MVAPQGEKNFDFSTPEGIDLCRKILIARLPFCPHDYQLTGVASILNGKNLLAISATGSGKTAYIYMTLHVILELQSNPDLSRYNHFPKNPAILVIYPTTALEENQEAKFKAQGLSAKAVNSNTKDAAQKRGEDIWSDVESNQSIILVSPEMLASTGFLQLVKSETFQTRLIAICMDEAHLLHTWGGEFRPAFRQVGFVRARFRRHVVLVAMTATLLSGNHTKLLTAYLGLDKSGYTLLHRSNARRDIQLTFRTLKALPSSENFSQLDWILNQPGKTLIFCSSILYGFRVAVYLWSRHPRGELLAKDRIRLFNSLHSTQYNQHTIELLESSDASRITIATDKLSVGVDIPDFKTVVIIEPSDLNDLWQKAGRAGRDRKLVPNAHAIIYIQQNTMNLITNPEGAATSRSSKQKGKQTNAETAACLRDIVLAKCYAAEIDRQYGNPAEDVPCSAACTTCAARSGHGSDTRNTCNCSACLPETVPDTPEPAQSTLVKESVPRSIHVTQKMRTVGKSEFTKFREQLWLHADEASTGMVPEEEFFPEYIMDDILDGFITTLTKDLVEPVIKEAAVNTQLILPYICDNQYLVPVASDVLQLVWNLHLKFDEMRRETKEAAAKAAKITRDAKKAQAKAEIREPDGVDADPESSNMDVGTGISDGRLIPAKRSAGTLVLNLRAGKLHIKDSE